jgi:hypothetical protein
MISHKKVYSYIEPFFSFNSHKSVKYFSGHDQASLHQVYYNVGYELSLIPIMLFNGVNNQLQTTKT